MLKRALIEACLMALNRLSATATPFRILSDGSEVRTVTVLWHGVTADLQCDMPTNRVRGGLSLTITDPVSRLIYRGVTDMQLTDVQKVTASIAATDAKGNPAEVADVVWSSSDESILSVVADAADPSKAIVTAVGPLGHAQVLVTADADLGDGVTAINAIGEVDVMGSSATTLGVNFGEPENA